MVLAGAVGLPKNENVGKKVQNFGHKPFDPLKRINNVWK